MQDYLDNTNPNDLNEFYSGVSTLIPLKLSWIDYQIWVQKGANDAHGNDVLSVREAVANWLNKAHPTHSPLDISSRGNHGIKHEMTGQLLCPIEYDWTDERWAIFVSCFKSILNHAQSVRAKLRNCNLDKGFDFAMNFFFYVDYEGDQENIEKGFLRSTLLVQVYF